MKLPIHTRYCYYPSVVVGTNPSRTTTSTSTSRSDNPPLLPSSSPLLQQQLVLSETGTPWLCSYKILVQLLHSIQINKNNNHRNNHRDDEKDDDGSHHLPSDMIQRIIEYVQIQPVQMKDVRVTSYSSSDSDDDNNNNNNNDNNNDGTRGSTGFPVSRVLEETTVNWWMSSSSSANSSSRSSSSSSTEDNSNNNNNNDNIDRLYEYLEFCVVPTTVCTTVTTMRRIRSVSIKIPPLPYGPCSVSTFYIEIMDPHIHTIHPPTIQNKNHYCGIDPDRIQQPHPKQQQKWVRVTPEYRVRNINGWQTYPINRKFDDDDNDAIESHPDHSNVHYEVLCDRSVFSREILLRALLEENCYQYADPNGWDQWNYGIDVKYIRFVCTNNMIRTLNSRRLLTNHTMETSNQVGLYCIRFD